MKRLILDCDVGTDDALALLILLKAESQKLVKIEAICCTMGNTNVENVCRNVIRLLEVTKRTDIPIYRGVPEELIKCSKVRSNFHGTDGFGDIPFENPPDLSIIKKDPSPLAMYNIAKEYENEVYLMVLGPLTNVALTMKIHPDFSDHLKGIYIMGGNYKGVGNITKAAEYNFHVDPEAAHIVLNGAKCPLTLLPWESCLTPKITYDWRWNVFGKINNKAIELLTKAEKQIYTDESVLGYWTPCDAFLAAAFIRPDYVNSTKTFHATVELHGNETRGQLVLDHIRNEKDNVTIIKKIDESKFKKILLDLSTL